MGAEDTALALEYPEASKFRAAGYEKIETNKTYQGGVVRQYGKASFSRVFEAGHAGKLQTFPCFHPTQTLTLFLLQQYHFTNLKQPTISSIVPCSTGTLRRGQRASHMDIRALDRLLAGASRTYFLHHRHRYAIGGRPRSLVHLRSWRHYRMEQQLLIISILLVQRNRT
jgi:hypothetical protein